MQLDKVTQEFVDNHKRYCSITSIKWWQGIFYILFICSLTFLMIYRWDISLCLITFYFAFWYFIAAFFKGMAVIFALLGMGERKVDISEIEALNEEELPIFTILIPLYMEANIADKIITSMDSLDYPKEKMDIKLLLEADDTATIAAVNRCTLSDSYDVIIVPDFQPKTKPRACNFGLKRAKGEYCVIYDAEDRPDTDQLKKIVILFRRLPDKFACIQAKLNYYNSTQNLLTKWFTIEYSTLFDLVLPGLEILNIPIPLGGTSNHFRTDILKKIGKQKEILRVKTYAKGYGVRVTKMVGGKRVPRTVNEIKANLAKKKDYLKDPTNHHILSIEYLRNAAKKQGVRVTKNVGGKRVSKNENELLKNLGNMRT